MTTIISSQGETRTELRSAIVAEIEDRIKTGATVKAACDALNVAVPSFYRWRAILQNGKSPAESSDSRKIILRAATQLFLREGYGVSLDKIAQTAGVARQTLFNRFGNKERLFREVVQTIFERMMDSLLHIEPNRTFRETLKAYAQLYLETAFDPEGIALHRLTIAELRDFPDLARLVYSLGASKTVPVLSKYIKQCMDDGIIRSCDPVTVAETFLGSVTGPYRTRALMQAGDETPGEMEEHVKNNIDSVVDIFVRGLEVRPEDRP